MSVKIVMGRSGAGKTSLCLERIEKLSKTEDNIYLIVPDQYSHRAEENMLKRLGVCFEGKASSITFSRLARRIFEKSGLSNLRYLSPSGKSMLSSRAVYLEKNNLTFYKNSHDKQGFSKKLLAVLTELKRYGITKEDLKKSQESIKSEVLSGKISDIIKIYSRYNQMFKTDFHDSDDDLFLASAKLSETDYLKGAKIFIDGFSDFLPSHYALLEEVLKRAESAEFYITADKNSDFFSLEMGTIERIKEICYRLGLDLKIENLDKNLRYNEKEDLRALEENYTEHKINSFEGECENIEIFQANSIFSEIENLAGSIIKLLREENVKMRDITVAVGDMEGYFRAISHVFNIYGLPFYMPKKETLSDSPLVISLLSVFDIFISGYEYEDIFVYLKSGFSNLSKEEADTLENYVLKAGIKKKNWLSNGDWTFKSGLLEEETEEAKKIDKIRRKAVSPLLALRENLGSKHTVKEACTAIYNFLEETKVYEKIKQTADSLKEEGFLFRANMIIKSYNAVLEVLNQLVTIAGNDKIGLEQMKNMLSAGFLAETLLSVPQTADEINILSFDEAKLTDTKIMFILGANLGDFSFGVSSEGIISDEEREELFSSGVIIAPSTSDALMSKRSGMYKILTKAKKKTYISYSLSGFEGEALMPSYMADRARKILPKITYKENTDLDKTYEYQYAAKMPAYLNMCAKKDGDRIWQSVYSLLKEDKDFKEKIDLFDKAKEFKNEALSIAEFSDTLYKNGLNSSVSRLEKHIACPFSYFIEFTLKAKERKELKIGAPDIGSVMHYILETFVKRCVESDVDWHSLDEDKIRALILQITKEYYAGILKNTAADNKANRYLLRRIEQNVTSCAMILVNHIKNGEFEPAECELKFGLDGKVSAVMVDLTSGKKLKIHGIIDRVDKCETEDGTYFRVIDYKSGSKEFKLDKVFHGLDLQLSVYLMAVTDDDKKKKAGMLYFKIGERLQDAKKSLTKEEAFSSLEEKMRLDGLVLDDKKVLSMMDNTGDLKSKIIPVRFTNSGELYKNSKAIGIKHFENLFKEVKKNLKKIGDSIVSGKTDIRPVRHNGKSPCDYCRFKQVCRFDGECGGFNDIIKLSNEEVIEHLNKKYGEEL